MLLDKLFEFSDAQALAGTAGTTILSTNQVDLSVVRDIGRGRPLYLVISVDTEIITAGSAGTLQFAFVSDDSATIHATTRTVHFLSRAFVTDDSAANSAEMNAGAYPVVLPIPLEGVPYERYLGVQYIPATTDITAGAVSAYLTFDPPSQTKTYADATN